MFRKKKTEHVYSWTEKTDERLEGLENAVKSLKDENEKLHRIMKYSSSLGSAMSHRLEDFIDFKFDGDLLPRMVRQYKLYIYYKKEEYCIPLKELDSERVSEDYGLEWYKDMGDDCVCFKVKSKYNVLDAEKIHNFIINYKTGEYMHGEESVYGKKGE